MIRLSSTVFQVSAVTTVIKMATDSSTCRYPMMMLSVGHYDSDVSILRKTSQIYNVQNAYSLLCLTKSLKYFSTNHDYL